MTLDQYLGTVAWLFMAFLMWFSVTRCEKCNLGYGLELYFLMTKVKMKPVFTTWRFFTHVVWPSMGWSVVLPIWFDSINKLLT